MKIYGWIMDKPTLTQLVLFRYTKSGNLPNIDNYSSNTTANVDMFMSNIFI